MAFDREAMGARIEMRRKEKGFTRAQLAAAIGCVESFVGHIENGTRLVAMDKFYLVCEVLDISADFLLTGSTDIEWAISVAHTLKEMIRTDPDKWLSEEWRNRIQF